VDEDGSIVLSNYEKFITKDEIFLNKRDDLALSHKISKLRGELVIIHENFYI